MKVYYYHTQDVQYSLRRLAEGEFPPHFLYGATKFEKLGVGVVWHKSCPPLPRWRMMLRNTWKILTCRETFDAVYAVHYRGIEPLVLLRALRLFRKPIVVWHHQPVVKPKEWWRDILGRIFYRGFDQMFFFSKALLEQSLKTGKIKPEQALEGHWGPQLPLFSKKGEEGSEHSASAISLEEDERKISFISSGKELRDMPTLVSAFNSTGAPLSIYVARQAGEINYEKELALLEMKPNINLHFIDGLQPYEISREVEKASVVVICCLPSKYTVGLTTLVEALALGKAIITTDNVTFPFDVEKEHIGLKVPYGDTKQWEDAIKHMQQNPDDVKHMGQKARRLAVERYNDDICAKEAVAVFRKLIST